jgi:flagellar basal-body rod modification protein FlgD
MNTVGEVTYSNPNTINNGSQIASSAKLGKNDFLNLLVTQLRYQDPMNPMQDQEFVAQLAQFSQLEQLESMSQSLDTSTQVNYLMSQTIANTMATTLIGKTVVAEGANLNLTQGKPVSMSYNLAADAANVTIKVLNDKGAVVRTIDLSDKATGNNTYTWDGRDNNGSSLADGEYSYEVTATTKTGETITSSKRIIGPVDAVKYIDGKAYLTVGSYKVDMSTIIEIVNDGRSSNQNNS